LQLISQQSLRAAERGLLIYEVNYETQKTKTQAQTQTEYNLLFNLWQTYAC
jgi:hypothetical protein